MKLCFATNNIHKVKEVADAVNGQLHILTLNELSVFDELPETKQTLEGNSLQKAQFVFNKIHIPCFADDSGLEVEALGGAPGVRSARYAGDQRDDNANIDLLLKNLDGASNRRARFRTVIALVGFKDLKFFEGTVNGQIITSKKGSGGFGYDPVFLPDGQSKTFAEMSLLEKNRLSHRAIAIQKLVRYLNENANG
jgi:XTP/dITP diphosphohydrolase